MARILLVDDEALLRTLLQHRLMADGYEVLALEDGEGVFDALRDFRPDLLILDGMMPVMDGFEILRRLKSSDDPSPLPVIMLTALNREADIVDALELGAADYLTKPFILGELCQRVRKALASEAPSSAPTQKRRRHAR